MFATLQLLVTAVVWIGRSTPLARSAYPRLLCSADAAYTSLEDCILCAKNEDEVKLCMEKADEEGEARLENCSGNSFLTPLATAQNAAVAAGSLLNLGEVELAELLLEAKLSGGSGWRWHIDGGSHIAIVLLDEMGSTPVALSVLWSPSELAFATRDGGALVQQQPLKDDEPPRRATAGGASSRHQVMHLPSAWSEEVEELVVETFSAKMPLKLVRPDQAATDEAATAGFSDRILPAPWWSGLLDVALGRADVAVVPPSRLLPFESPQRAQPPPPALLFALHLLLAESGGVLSGVLGEELEMDLTRGRDQEGGALASLAASHGLLACEYGSHNFVSAHMRHCFCGAGDGAMFVDLGGLREKLKGFNDGGFTVEYE